MSARRATRRPRIVRCPGCEKPLHDGRPVTQLDAKLQGWGRTSSGAGYRREYDGQIGWHTACLDEWNAQNAASRRKGEIEELRGLYIAMVVEGSMTRERFMEIANKPPSKYTPDMIAEAVPAAGEGRRY